MPDGTPSLRFHVARAEDAVQVAVVRIAAARDLAKRFGPGPWASECTERGVLSGYRLSAVVLAYENDIAVGTFRLTSRKPWAIDRSLFTPAARPLYLTDMAVHPRHQRRGIGRACLEEAIEQARRFPADAVWLDAYDAPAGAAAFYASCGFRECGRQEYRGTPHVYFERAVEPVGAP